MESRVEGNAVVFEGVLNEKSNFLQIEKSIDELSSSLGDEEAVKLDFSAVSGGNSTGISNWLKIQSAIQGSIDFVNTPFWLVLQMNMIEEFTDGNVVVSSVIVPFYAPEKDLHQDLKMEIGKDIVISEDEDVKVDGREIDGNYYEPDFEPYDTFSFLQRIVDKG